MGLFKKAERTKARARVALDGPPGSGKTMSALRAACGLARLIAEREGHPAKVAVIDTERNSASLYAGDVYDDFPLTFEVAALTNFSPDRYIEAIEEANRENFDVLVIDSLSHAWVGKDGVLDMVSNSAERNKFGAWREASPAHRRLVDTILQARPHLFATMRSKVEWVVEQDEKGRNVPRKIGLAPVQRDDMEYEFTLYASIEKDSHILRVGKTRCSLMEGRHCREPGVAFWTPFFTWLYEGAEAPPEPVAPEPVRFETPHPPTAVMMTPETASLIVQATAAAGMKMQQILPVIADKYGAASLIDLTEDQGQAMLKVLQRAARRTSGAG